MTTLGILYFILNTVHEEIPISTLKPLNESHQFITHSRAEHIIHRTSSVLNSCDDPIDVLWIHMVSFKLLHFGDILIFILSNVQTSASCQTTTNALIETDDIHQKNRRNVFRLKVVDTANTS